MCVIDNDVIKANKKNNMSVFVVCFLSVVMHAFGLSEQRGKSVCSFVFNHKNKNNVLLIYNNIVAVIWLTFRQVFMKRSSLVLNFFVNVRKAKPTGYNFVLVVVVIVF